MSRYKFQMFGYWAAIWVHLNRISEENRANPWSELVKIARKQEDWTNHIIIALEVKVPEAIRGLFELSNPMKII